MTRTDGRKPSEIRKVSITPNYLKYADGSVLIEMGNTKVICSAILEDYVPPHKKNSGSGWITAEYAMLPASSSRRVRREGEKAKGRTQEIQRLIGRSIRAVCNLDDLGEKTIIIDTDVIQADGGTRCAAVTGAFVALKLAVKKLLNERKIEGDPIRDNLAAVSVGRVLGYELVDLNYAEDSQAEVDMNLVMNEKGELIEIQGTAEASPFSQDTLNSLINKGRQAIFELIKIQKGIIE